MNPIRILIADDHALVRAGIRALAETLSGVEVVAEAADGREALALMKSRKPDVAVMDISMPGLNGIDATAHATRDCPQVRVLILSAHPNEDFIVQALRAGAVGYLLKGSTLAEFEVALRAVARGETYLSPAVSSLVISDFLRHAGPKAARTQLLTTRQREILQLIAEGRTTKEIARLLHLSAKTVETHRMQLMQRLNIHDVAGLVRYALRIGLVTADQ
jgi:DNA-binding NarL/FixJ family response regulator